MKKVITLLLGFVVLTCAYAQKLPLIKYPDNFEFITRTVNTGSVVNDLQYVFQFRSLKKSNGNMVFECKLAKINTIENQAGFLQELNTEKIKDIKFSSSSVLLPLAILQQPLQVTITPQGNLFKIDGLERAVEDAVIKWHLSAGVTEELKNNVKYFPGLAIENLFLQLPAQKLVYGTQWESGDAQLYYKITGIKGDLIQIISDHKKTGVKPAGDRNGTYSFNKKNGLIENSKIISKVEGVSTTAERSPFEINTVYTQQVRLMENKYQIDTTWLNMAVRMSFVSDFFRNNGGSDSVKIYNFFKINDLRFKGDRYYMANKIGLAQQIRGGNGNKLYEALLDEIPNDYLKGESAHLYNKMSNMLDKSPAATYEVSKYFYKDALFNDWLQESFAQHFIDFTANERFKTAIKEEKISNEQIAKMKTERNKKAVNSYALLELLHQDKNLLMQQKTAALYLWVEAQTHETDPVFLVNTANQLKKLDEIYLKQGNGNRYALLTYNLLVAAKKEQEADELLSVTIQTLEKYTADTLNQRRYADQYLLAHAYYLKYTAAKNTDSVNALKYLSKAASFSPKDATQKAYTSFYDRVFLDAKESYREDFLKELFKNGSDKEAMNVFVEHINASPERIDEMQKTYHDNFPDKDFREFFTENVLNSWQKAPEFMLSGLDDKTYQIADYKNKWLVVDFWGTWCMPCREEMPSLNAFNDEIEEGKHNGINFLSIACRDERENVKSYIKNNQFNLPVVMSDQLVEQQYQIKSYPSKVIISPDGKMLKVNYGTDWKVTVKKFSELYGKN